MEFVKCEDMGLDFAEDEDEEDEAAYVELLEMYLNSRRSLGSVYSLLISDDGASRRKNGSGDEAADRGCRFNLDLDLGGVDLGTVSGRLDDKFESKDSYF